MKYVKVVLVNVPVHNNIGLTKMQCKQVVLLEANLHSSVPRICRVCQPPLIV